MNTRTPLLNPQGLLAALVAMTLSGMAIAETAGRVNFVSGGVVAVSTDGSKRTLTRGDFINSGERIETNRGRAQIRFTDGSFLSLQPDTVFGVDNYTFSKAKPDEGSLLFNFVRGSMRTVSGAIGKVNRANYKVKTPVATIGIRGTGYASSYRNDEEGEEGVEDAGATLDERGALDGEQNAAEPTPPRGSGEVDGHRGDERCDERPCHRGHAKFQRRLAGFPVDGHEPRLGLDHQVVARPLGFGPRAVVARHRAIDQVGLDGLHRLVPEAQPFDHARAEILDQHIGVLDQPRDGVGDGHPVSP